MLDRIYIKPGNCTGCKSCELACSYHHLKIFNPIYSSIKIRKDYETDKIDIVIYKERKDSIIMCDNCINESVPLCVKFCLTNALNVKLEVE
jgi:Fe-S-cluster-containing hydrogenase component 2